MNSFREGGGKAKLIQRGAHPPKKQYFFFRGGAFDEAWTLYKLPVLASICKNKNSTTTNFIQQMVTAFAS